MANASILYSDATMDAVVLRIDHLVSEVTELRATHGNFHVVMDDRTNAIEVTWVFLTTSLVMLMQLGFALVESGSVRHKSYHHIFLKNMTDFSFSLVLWFFFGYWVAFPDLDKAPFDFSNFEMLWNAPDCMAFCFQAVFASTAVTIVSGSMAERTRMEAYLAFVVLCTGMLYSVIVRWSWGGGFLSKLEPVPFHDFAGSGVVHLCGGVAAFVGAVIVGPRAGLYDPENIRSEIDVYTKHSYDSVVMGTIMLWFGWLGFNSGSTASMVNGASDTVAVAMVNTLIAPSVGGIVSLAVSFTNHSLSKLPHDERPPRFDLGYTCNALLGGLVGVTAGCDKTPPEWACVVGIVAAFVLHYFAKFCRRIQIDDPVDASSVHGACGVWGLISIALFHREQGLITQGNHELLIAQLIGIGSIIAYISTTAFVYFWVVHCYGLLRLDLFIEVSGIDWIEMKEGRNYQEATDLEVQAVERYKDYLQKRMAGDMWGKNMADVLLKFAGLHRTVTTTLLTCAIIYNYVFYLAFEWHGFEFFAIVNLAVGSQSAAAAHAQFNLSPEMPLIKKIGLYVVMISWFLACVNFVLANEKRHDSADGEVMSIAEETELLLTSWAKTASLSFAWSGWLHMALHPIDWDDVCYAINVRGSKYTHAYFLVLMGWSRATTPVEYIVGLISVGRLQHVCESTLTFASATSDMWVGLDEFINKDMIMGSIIIVFSCMQLSNVINKLINPTGLRTIWLMQKLTMVACLIEIPLMLIIIFFSDSPLKWISVGMSWGAILVMMTVLLVVMYAAKVKQRLASRPPEQPDILMIEIPVNLIESKAITKGKDHPGNAESEKEKPDSPPLYESSAPPSSSSVPAKSSIPTPQGPAPNLYSDTGDITELIGPLRLNVLGWEPAMEGMPLTPKGVDGVGPQTPRAGYDGAETPRLRGILTVTTLVAEAARSDSEWLCNPSPGKASARGGASRAME